MKKLFLIFFCATLFLGGIHPAIAQNVAITDDDLYSPNSSAMLDVKSVSKGILIPRLTAAQRTGISAPPTGLLVFDTNFGCFFYYTGTVWTNLSAGNPNNLFTKNSNRVYLEDTLNMVGLGTRNPSGKLVVKGDNALSDTVGLS